MIDSETLLLKNMNKKFATVAKVTYEPNLKITIVNTSNLQTIVQNSLKLIIYFFNKKVWMEK